ncbi:rab geranylgeranyltransferase [Hygrophoropsis aurantiaca]|uniref:Rab geranylgeranyltransferase n=1 Tax=Hygrophoropsis aurantiaca TaxID=72124 RepID=A0ACB7ZXR6_9AGAM|nr:rab geranylgeranyltransferase [Hygrophoropsis aurantiaca]
MTSDSLLVPLHVSYIQSLANSTDDLAYHMSAHLRMNAIYWGLTALCTMRHKDALDREELIDWVMSCWDEEAGAFGAHPGHDAHILTTLSAIQILITHDALDKANLDRIADFILSLHQPSGTFAGDCWGETDTRFIYIALSALTLTRRIHRLTPDAVERTVGYLRACKNFDGGFGASAGAESHATQVFVCLAALAILDRIGPAPGSNNPEIADSAAMSDAAWRLDDTDTLAWWLCERQRPSGGLNGRPEKLEDVCYSFWVLASLAILGRLSWIDAPSVVRFVLSAQDLETGGIADRPGDMVDVFHTHFGIAALALLDYPGLAPLDPVFCMPVDVIERLGLRKAVTK